MEGFQALVLDHKLRHLAAWTEERKRRAVGYLEALRDLPLALPRIVHGDHVYHLFVVRTPYRDKLCTYLAERGIETGLHYPIPLHRQPCFSHLPLDRNSFPISDRFAGDCLSLPLFAGMSDRQAEAVIAAVRTFLFCLNAAEVVAVAQEEESDARLSGWPLRLRRILPALTCPACQGELKPSCDAVTCASCRERFPVRGGKIHFIELPVDDLDSISGG